MQVTNYIAKTSEDIFKKFDYKIDLGEIRSVRCIAYQGIVSDEVYSLYEIYQNSSNIPRYFGVSEYDHDGGDIERTIEVMKNWAQAKGATLLAHSNVDFLFELINPFGIRFE